jgi:uncharacterized protein YeaO (DUF488 family)
VGFLRKEVPRRNGGAGQEANPRSAGGDVAKKYRAEMAAPDKRRILDLLAAMSHQSNFSVGCYCEEESRCHRSVLLALLEERGAQLE